MRPEKASVSLYGRLKGRLPPGKINILRSVNAANVI